MGKVTIGIDASRYNLQKATGVENYSNEIISRLVKNKDFNFVLWSNKPKPDSIKGSNVLWKTLRAKKFWTQTALSRELFRSRNKVDVVFIPSHVIPYLTPRKLPIVTTLHDLSFIKYPQAYTKFQYKYLNYALKQLIKAKLVIVPSNAVKSDLEKYTDLPSEKVQVIYHGIDRTKFRIKPISINYPKNIKQPYILYTGRITVKKNLITLIKSYILLKQEQNFKHQLVLVGKTEADSKNIFDFINDLTMDIRGDIIYTGYLNEKNYILSIMNADIYVLPSIDEGFGLTALEAMTARVPTVVSKVPTLQEICEDGVLYANPNKPYEFAGAISKIIHQNKVRQVLIEKGRELAKKFNWDKSARQTLNVLLKAVK